MNKFWKYIAGVIKAVKGEYPYEKLEHLEFIKRKLKDDDDHLNAEHRGIKVITARHVSIISDAWRSTYLLPHASLRRVISKTDWEMSFTPDLSNWLTKLPKGVGHEIDLMQVYRDNAVSSISKDYRLDRVLVEDLGDGKCVYGNLQQQIYRNFQGSGDSQET